MRGNLPKNLTVVVKRPQNINVRWENSDANDTDLVTFNARPAFVCDTSRPKTIETARSWASHDHEWVNGKWTARNGYEQFTVDNTPDFCKDVRITGLVKRTESGTSYKAVIAYKGENYYVDFREDALLDIMLNAGIEIGGRPKCELMWGKVGAQMRLIRVGSHVHKELVKATMLDEIKPVSQKDLIVGDVFENKTGEKQVYLGKYTTVKMHLTKREDHGYYHKVPQRFDRFEVYDTQVWYQFKYRYSYENNTCYKKIAANEEVFKDFSIWHVKLTKKSATKKRADHIDVPSGIIDRIKSTASIEALNKVLLTDTERYLQNLSYYCDMLHLTPIGTKPVLNQAYSRFSYIPVVV